MIDLDAILKGPRPRAEEIRDAVCRAFEFTPERILNQGERRRGNQQVRRQIAMCRSVIAYIGIHCGYSTGEIAKRCFGGRIQLNPASDVITAIKADVTLQAKLVNALFDIRDQVMDRQAVAA